MTVDARAWFVYLVRCADGSLYCGISTDVAKRVASHNAGRGAKYTKTRRPVVLVAQSGPLPESVARRSEIRIKRLPRRLKLAAVAAIKA